MVVVMAKLLKEPVPPELGLSTGNNQVVIIPLERWIKLAGVDRGVCFDGGHYLGLKHKVLISHSTYWGRHMKVYYHPYEARRTFDRVSVSVDRYARWVQHAKGLIALDTATKSPQFTNRRLRNLAELGHDLSGLTDEQLGQLAARQVFRREARELRPGKLLPTKAIN